MDQKNDKLSIPKNLNGFTNIRKFVITLNPATRIVSMRILILTRHLIHKRLKIIRHGKIHTFTKRLEVLMATVDFVFLNGK